MKKQNRKLEQSIVSRLDYVTEFAPKVGIEFGGLKMRNHYGNWVVVHRSQVGPLLRYQKPDELLDMVNALVGIEQYIERARSSRG